MGKLTIGVGWNLTDNGLPESIIDALLDEGIKQAQRDARAVCSVFDDLSDARQRVLVNMAFNLGRAGLAGFKNTLAQIAAGDYERAADNMLLSKWATQVGARAVRLAAMMRAG